MTAANPRVAYFDCYSGASGDMILGALLDGGLAESDLRTGLQALGLDGYTLVVEKTQKAGFAGTHVRVILDEPRGVERHLSEIEGIVGNSALPEAVRERALRIFQRLGAVEAQVHGIDVHAVHFHEVGAVDAIVDVVGAVLGLALLGIEGVYASTLPLGHGMVQSAHGLLPLPAPATLGLIAQVGAPTRPVDIDLELVTPTGAAILTTLATFGQPPMTIDRIGTGFGTRELPWPNALRVWLGHRLGGGYETGEVTVIETNLDDLAPELVGFAMERLFAAGALDVFLTPVQMKKNRPGVVLTVLAPPARAEHLAQVILRETSSIGVRFRTSQRLMAPRRPVAVQTTFGTLEAKIKTIDGLDIVVPEYEACAKIARDQGVPLAQVYAAVIAAAHDSSRKDQAWSK